MAKFHYDLNGAEPIIRDVPMYDAATIVNGEFIMVDPATATDCQFITGYAGDNTELVDALGISTETITTTSTADPGDAVTTAATTTADAISSIAATVAQGNRYGKAIINPFAVYLTEYSQAAADDVALTGAWSTTTLTLTSLEDNIDGGWVLGGSASTTTNFAGQLHYLSASASGSATVLAPTVAGAATNDTIIKILPKNHRLTALTADGTKLASAAAAGSGVSATIVENYLGGANTPLEALRKVKHDGGDYGSNAKVYADVLLTDHIYNPA